MRRSRQRPRHAVAALFAASGGTFYGNTGSWSPAFRDVECTQPLSDERPVVWLRRADASGAEITGGLYAWRGGRFEPRVTRELEPLRGGSQVDDRLPGAGVLTPVTADG